MRHTYVKTMVKTHMNTTQAHELPDFSKISMSRAAFLSLSWSSLLSIKDDAFEKHSPEQFCSSLWLEFKLYHTAL